MVLAHLAGLSILPHIPIDSGQAGNEEGPHIGGPLGVGVVWALLDGDPCGGPVAIGVIKDHAKLAADHRAE